MYVYSRRLCLSTTQHKALTKNAMARVIINPQWLFSNPFSTFIPYKEAMKVPDIIIMETEVRVRIVVFMLLLMMLEYVSIVDSSMSE